MDNEAKQQAPHDIIEVFVQVEGKQQITIVRIGAEVAVHELIEEVVRLGLLDPAHRTEVATLLEDVEAELGLEDRLHTAGVKHRARMHFHRCRRIAVAVHFNGDSRQREFRPSASIGRIFEWAVGEKGFNLTPTDAVEHLLQITGTSQRPDEDAHVGTLTHAPACAVSFDLVPKRRVEG